ncbi:putative ABC transporter (Permease proteine) [uncultured Alphaproteobacteria bacterium]|uniref:Putative ABC transporter (Permease proteine) n=1 Tax=uncultured Alphaproteobacteria bacterium TaxID=91750 RepID=A0A212KMT3_9PROT|nr:putative ABC transporter (Permease proteine) [uncultured Alphaproteobacteria bacterium]
MTFSLSRLFAMVVKELVQIRRDRLTFGMMVGIPLMQLLLFGYAINSDPKHLPAAIRDADHGPVGRAVVAAMQASRYFDVTLLPESEAEAAAILARGDAQFVVSIPPDFSRRVLRGERPGLLVEADATDPAATASALGVLERLSRHAADRDLSGPNARLRQGEPPFELIVHRLYNPEGETAFNIVPGLMGVVLTMTMVIMTCLAVTRERERGTMESLLAMPLTPLEVMLGKILPYVAIGYAQVAFILVAAKLLFAVPMVGDLVLLSAVTVVFIVANLAVGFTFSTLAANQLQAVQMGFFFFLPSIMLSGFMFPFRGMPEWAQVLGEALPLTHFLRVVRGILLKGNGWSEIALDVAAMAAFVLAAGTIAIKRYRMTLD